MSRTSGVNEEEEECVPVIIGGMVLDINSTPSIPALPKTTTPGKVPFFLLCSQSSKFIHSFEN